MRDLCREDTYYKVDGRRLAVVDSRVIVKAMYSVRNARNGIFLSQTQHRIDILLLFCIRQLSPVGRSA